LRPFNNRKLQFRSKRCAFIGYNNLHKGFKCLDISTGRIYISRDVVFYEGVFPFASLHPNAGAQLRSEVLLLPQNTGGTTTHKHMVDDSTNPPNNLQDNAEISCANTGVFKPIGPDFMQPRTRAEPETDSAATSVAPASGSKPRSTSAAAPTAPAPDSLPQASGARSSTATSAHSPTSLPSHESSAAGENL
jgi:hypothetical protein